MSSFSTQGLVLKKTKLAESDLIITLLSEDGRQLRAVAKGARKPGNRSASRLELFSVADLLLAKGRSLNIISEVRLVDAHAACRSAPERMTAAMTLCEFLEVVTREADVEPRLYPMACETLRCLGAIPVSGIEIILAAGLLKCAGQIGYLPALHECALCGSEVKHALEHAWSVNDGGLLCEECAGYQEDVLSIRGTLLSWLRLCVSARFVDLEEYVASNTESSQQIGSSLIAFSHAWIQAHLGLSLKSIEFLRDFLPK